jgi:hypothetical protein
MQINTKLPISQALNLKNPTFSVVLHQIVNSTQFLKLTSTQKSLYYALRKYSNGWHKPVWPKNIRLMSDLGCKERTVQTSLKKLQELGFIHIKTDGNHRKIYFFAALKPESELLNPATGCA